MNLFERKPQPAVEAEIKYLDGDFRIGQHVLRALRDDGQSPIPLRNCDTGMSTGGNAASPEALLERRGFAMRADPSKGRCDLSHHQRGKIRFVLK